MRGPWTLTLASPFDQLVLYSRQNEASAGELLWQVTVCPVDVQWISANAFSGFR